MNRIRTFCWLLFLLTVFSFEAEGHNRSFKWTIATDPYRNYIYPQQSGVRFNLSYHYLTESKSLRRYLKRNFDVRASPSISRIMKDVSSGVYFERFFECKIKHLQKSDTLLVKITYENDETVIERIPGGQGTFHFNLHLTRYKGEHDFSTGQKKPDKKHGLVTCVDMFVISQTRHKDYVMILSKVFTQADMPGILSKVNGKEILK